MAKQNYIETNRVLQTGDGVLIPAGVRLEFRGGKAKFQGHTIDRKLIPLDAIKDAGGPFKHAVCATIFNDNRAFAAQFDKRFQDWAHVVVYGDAAIVYIWDTRKVIDVITGLHEAVKGGPIQKKLKNKETGEIVVKTIGWNKYGWAKFFYDMLTWPMYHRPDNGLPLVTDNADWKPIVDKFNGSAQKFFVGLEANSDIDKIQEEFIRRGYSLPDGSYPISDVDSLKDAIHAYGRSKDKKACKFHIVKRAIDLDRPDLIPQKWIDEDAEVVKEMRRRGIDEKNIPAVEQVVGHRGNEVMVFRYDPGLQGLLRQLKIEAPKSEPWLHLGIATHTKDNCWAIYIWDTRKVIASGTMTREQMMTILHACWQTKNSAIDNGRKLDGGGNEVAAMNRCYALEALIIKPADGIANEHDVIDDATNELIARITAEQLEQVRDGYYNPDDLEEDVKDEMATVEDESKDETEDKEEAEVIEPIPAYKNTDKNKLVVRDKNGEVLDLKCLEEPIVTERAILDELIAR